jgi:hypothetical protein
MKRAIDDTMEFIPAGEIIGEAHQVPTVSIKQSPQLPDGGYSFIDTYCGDVSSVNNCSNRELKKFDHDTAKLRRKPAYKLLFLSRQFLPNLHES